MTAGRYTPRKSNLTDSTAFSFSPMIFAYFIPASGSAPATVMTPHTRAPPALAARQKDLLQTNFGCSATLTGHEHEPGSRLPRASRYLAWSLEGSVAALP